MQNFDCDVLIVGGGLVGATLACALLQQNLQVVLVEATPLPTHEHSHDPRTFALTRASEKILANLRVWDKISPSRMGVFRQMHVWDASGPGEIHFDSAAIHQPLLGHIVEGDALRVALSVRLTELPGLTLYRPARVEHFTVNSKEVVAQLSTGDTLTTRLLVGAEGANSAVRSLSGIPYTLHDYAQQALVTTVWTEFPHQETAWQRFLPSGPLGFLPLFDPHSCSIVWSVNTPDIQRLMNLSKTQFHEELEHAFASKLGKITESQEYKIFPLKRRHVLHYVKPRIALVGDAAHTVHPLAGQGVNLGLLDVATLSEVVSQAYHVHRDIGNYAVLRRYERWRKGHNTMVSMAMDGFKYLFGSDSEPATWLRNAGLSLFDTMPFVKQAIMKQAMGLSGDLPALATRWSGDGI